MERSIKIHTAQDQMLAANPATLQEAIDLAWSVRPFDGEPFFFRWQDKDLCVWFDGRAYHTGAWGFGAPIGRVAVATTTLIEEAA